MLSNECGKLLLNNYYSAFFIISETSHGSIYRASLSMTVWGSIRLMGSQLRSIKSRGSLPHHKMAGFFAKEKRRKRPTAGNFRRYKKKRETGIEVGAWSVMPYFKPSFSAVPRLFPEISSGFRFVLPHMEIVSALLPETYAFDEIRIRKE